MHPACILHRSHHKKMMCCSILESGTRFDSTLARIVKSRSLYLSKVLHQQWLEFHRCCSRLLLDHQRCKNRKQSAAASACSRSGWLGALQCAVLEDIPGRAGDATGQVDLCAKAGNNPEIARKPANVSPKSSPSKKPNRKLNNHVMVIEKVVVLPPWTR